MGDLSNYAENKLLDHINKKTAFTRPTNIYLALLTDEPDDADTGGTIVETTYTGYARVLLPTTSWASAASRATSNNTALAFSEALSTGGTVGYFAILDTSTIATGNVIAYGAVSPAKYIGIGTNPTCEAGDLDISFNAAGLSTFAANKLLDHTFKGVAYTQPTTLMAALSTLAITDANTGSTITEPGDTYTRIPINGMSAASGGSSKNSAIISFPAASTSWGTMKHFCILDALTTGNVLFHTTLTTVRAIGNGDVARFPINGIEVKLD